MNDSTSPLRVLVLSNVFPSSVDPSRGVFVKERIKALAALPGVEVRVIAPVPWFPPLKMFPKWYKWSQFPRQETLEGLQVSRPRYCLPPKIGGYMHPRLMFPPVRNVADQIRQEFPFNVIDSHFAYPAGVVATMLGERYNLPVIITGRGEDMLRFPDMPFKGKKIRWALKQASRCVALSNEIADAMRTNEAEPSRVSLIPNGVDTEKFRPLDRESCRRELGLPEDAKIILGVGDRLELKGFHLLVDAMPMVLRDHPNAQLVIVGGPGRFGRDYTAEIESRIEHHNLQDQVRLAGSQAHDSLPDWYNAADLFVLMSSREGSPNVLLEALACGTPAIATAVGGIADELADDRLGKLVAERTAESIATSLHQALSRDWNRAAIRHVMEARSWQTTARTVYDCIRMAVQQHQEVHADA